MVAEHAGLPSCPGGAWTTPVHFIGIGGVGMSGLATILLQRGVPVSGSDEAESPVLERLARLGATIATGHAVANVPAGTARVVYSSAVQPDNPELREAVRRGLPVCRRGEFLARLAEQYATVVAVGGSHGKTSTTAMIAHILRTAGHRPGFLIGGEMPGWPAPAAAGAGQILVTEVDESDGTQALLRSSHAVVTNVDDDHCWSLGGVTALEQCFSEFADRAQHLFTWQDATTTRLFAAHPAATFLTSAELPAALTLPVPGEHNRKNATVAVAVTSALGVPEAQAVAALASFQGVSRRLSERYRSPGAREIVVEDYAHHPNELRASLQALREQHPGLRLTVIFQPHRFERVKRYAAEFSQILEQAADAVFLLPPFAAWMQDQEVADPRAIVTAIRGRPAVYWENGLEELARQLVGAGEPPPAGGTLYAVIGAGDVGRLAGLLREALADRWLETTACELRNLPELTEKCRIDRARVWSELTTLGAGLGRPLVAYPETVAQLLAILRLAREHGAPVAALGAGSNLVGADWEPPRIWVCLRQGTFVQVTALPPDPGAWQAGSGVTLRALFEAVARAGTPSAEFAPLAWIPGTLGGAVRMNAGADGTSIGQLVTAVQGVRLDGTPWAAAGPELPWHYREAGIPADVLVTAVTLRLPPAAPEAAEARLQQSGERRRATQPAGRSAGCVFRNPGSTLSAGRLLERAGSKGMAVGGAVVSGQHANFIVTNGQVSEKDFLSLLLQVRQRVFKQTGVVLMPEVKFAGIEAETQLRTSLTPPQVVVLKGGPSSEREISLRSGTGVANALCDSGFLVTEIAFDQPELPELPAEFDLVFPVLHGSFGEDGQIQALLEARGLRYVGSGPAACKLIMDKLATKAALAAAGVPTAKWAVLKNAAAPMPAALRFPVVVKPNEQGSSLGISKVAAGDAAGWRKALQQAFALDPVVFCEEFLAGTEITVGLLGGRALPVVEIKPAGDHWYDYDAKYVYQQGKTEYLCPPQNVPASAQRQAQQFAEQAWTVLGAKDLLRVDFIVDAAGLPWCLEANAMPGFTPTSLLPKAAAIAGWSFPELCASLVKANL